MKFVRIVSQASKELDEKHKGAIKIKVSKDILQRLESYYYIDMTGLDPKSRTLLMKLHIEALRLMKTLASMNEFTSHVHSIVTMSLSQLVNNLQNMTLKLKSSEIVESRISLDWQFAAHTVDLVVCLLRYELYHLKKSAIHNLWSNYVKPLALSWLRDLIREKLVPQLDVCIAIASAMSYLSKLSNDPDIQSALCVLLSTTIKVKEPKENASLAYFNHLVRETERKSQFETILDRDGRLRDPKMLPSYGSLRYNTTNIYEYSINPMIDNDSPIILLELYATCMLQNQVILKDKVNEYVDNINTVRYLRCASKSLHRPKHYESFVQSSLLAQQEIYVMISLIIMQVKHYTEKRREDEEPDSFSGPEPKEVAAYRKESYSNLLLSAISIIGMVNPRTEYLVSLKDKLLEIAVLNHDLHIRLSHENYRLGSIDGRTRHDLEFYNRLGLNEFGESNFIIIEEQDMQILKPLYMSVEQPGRFWILEPIVEYYTSQLKENSQDKTVTDGRFFAAGINKQTGLAPPYDDSAIVSSLLRLHASIMHTSPAYNEHVLRPNIEEFLCIIGTIFLDNDLFLDPKVSKALRMNLELMVAECNADKAIFTNASRVIETLNLPLNDFFNKLADQYEACSYGDATFTNFLLLFITAKSDKLFKQKFFSEKVETCVAQMRLPLEQVWASSSLLFELTETDPEIRGLVIRAGRHVVPGSFMHTFVRKHLALDKLRSGSSK